MRSIERSHRRFATFAAGALLLGAPLVLSTRAEAAPLDKNGCAKLAQDMQNLKALDVDKLMENGPAWAVNHLSSADLGLVRQYIDLDEQMKFRCAAPGLSCISSTLRTRMTKRARSPRTTLRAGRRNPIKARLPLQSRPRPSPRRRGRSQSRPSRQVRLRVRATSLLLIESGLRRKTASHFSGRTLCLSCVLSENRFTLFRTHSRLRRLTP